MNKARTTNKPSSQLSETKKITFTTHHNAIIVPSTALLLLIIIIIIIIIFLFYALGSKDPEG